MTMIQAHEFVIQELQSLLSITELNNLLNSTVIFNEYKTKYYFWDIKSKRGNFHEILRKKLKIKCIL